MFKSIRRNIYQLVAVLFLAVQSLVVCLLLAAAVSIAQVNSSPAADKQQQPIIRDFQVKNHSSFNSGL